MSLDANAINDLARDTAATLADELMNRNIEVPERLTEVVEASVAYLLFQHLPGS